MRLLLSAFVSVASLVALSVMFAPRGANAQASQGVVTEAQAQRERGADLYKLRCAVCHGATGQGLAEARLAFPEDHRRCSRCHKRGNPALMANPFVDNNMFDVGDAPGLVGEDRLAAFPNAAVLYSYIHAAMPRHAPRTLADQEYWDITAHVLGLNHALPEDIALTEQNAATLSLP